MSEPTGQEHEDGRGLGVVMTIRTYRVGPDGTRTDYTPTLVVPSVPSSAMDTSGFVPCACPRCKARETGS